MDLCLVQPAICNINLKLNCRHIVIVVYVFDPKNLQARIFHLRRGDHGDVWFPVPRKENSATNDPINF